MNQRAPLVLTPIAPPARMKTSHLIAIYGVGVLLGALLMAVIGDVFGRSQPPPAAQIAPAAPHPVADALAAAPAAGPAAAIIANLGHANFHSRRQAEEQLAAMGAAVKPQLLQAAQTHPDEEVRLRAQKVLKRIEAGEGAQVAGGRAAQQEEPEEEDPSAMMQAMAEQQMMEIARQELAKARAQMERLGLTGRRGGGGAGGRIGNALNQMLGQQLGQLEQGMRQNDPNQLAPELPKLKLPAQQPPANHAPAVQAEPPPAGDGGAVNLKSSYGAVFGDANGAVRVVDVQADSAAAKAGLRTGDLITKINGRSVESGADIQAALAQIRAGQSYLIELTRKGEPLTLSATR